MNHKRKRPRKQSVGCPCCRILKNNSAARTRPKDREIGSAEWADEMGLSVDRVQQSRDELANGEWVTLEEYRRLNKITNYPRTNG